MSATESVRNPWKFPIQSRALGDAETGGLVIESAQIIENVPEEVAAEACKTGVLQRTYNGVWDFDGKNDINGRPTV